MGFELSFSFIVPAFNAATTLPACLKHIRAQEYPQHLIECIVVDNGSNDSTASIAQAQADSYLRDEEATIAGVRNRGAQQAKNAILVFVDADCLLSSSYASVAASLFTDSLVGMVGSKTHLLPDSVGWVARTWKVHLDRSQLDPNPSWLVTRALAVRRTAFEEVGGFDESIETCEDVAFGHAVRQRWKIVADDRLTPVHLDDPDSLSQFFRKEVWRAQNSVEISWKWIQQQPQLLFTKEGLSFLLPFYYSLALLLVFLGFLSFVVTGSPLAFFFAFLMFSIPIALLSFDTIKRANADIAFIHLATLYAVYIVAKVVALYTQNDRHRPRRVV